jgi:hypothetical protein
MCGGDVALVLTCVDAVPEDAAKEVAGSAAAALDLVLFQLDIEACEESGDAFVGKATLAERADFAVEQVDYLGGGESLFLSASGFAQLAGDDGDLFGSVGARLCHEFPLKWSPGKDLPGEIRLSPKCVTEGVP